MDPNFAAPPSNSRPRSRRNRRTARVGLVVAGAVGLGLAGIAGAVNQPVNSATSSGSAAAGPGALSLAGDAGPSGAEWGATGLSKLHLASLEATPGAGATAVAAFTRSSAPASNRFEIGDQIKIVFYERVDSAETDKWGRDNSALKGFQERPELSGEYNVQDDGTITLPLLGSFELAGKSSHDLQTALAGSFQKLTGHNALVSVLSIARPPVYVLGPVGKPGPYKYMPGMTVLHAIAMAGGFGNHDFQPWQQLEAVREVERGRGSIEDLPRLLARVAVLKSERDGTKAEPSHHLLRLTSKAKAKALIAEETEQRRSIIAARDAQEQALAASLRAAKQQVQTLSRREQPYENLIKLRQQRVTAMESLAARKMVSNLMLIQAQSDLADARQRQQDALNQYTTAQQQLDQIKQQQARLEADTKSATENAIAVAEQQIRDDDRQAATSRGVLHALGAINVSYEQPGSSGPHYEIVRRTAHGPVMIAATGLTTLQPGDLVRIEQDDATAGSPAAAPDSAPTLDPAKAQDPGTLFPIRETSAR
ncbi:MAG TPA: polysaccharide biosynthesis/export family protein [Stellaceae bacterium]|nr:polysaccharide biosynthesis/export family protein [Stellaceae bacterium]